MSRSSKINILIAAVFLTISIFFSLPNIIGYLKSTNNRVYNGNSNLWDTWDINVYVSALRYSQVYGWKYQNLYTTNKSPNNVVLYPIYSLLGILFPVGNPYIVYNISAFLAIFILISSIYKTLLIITNSRRMSFYSSMLACFAGGFGWIVSAFNILSADFAITPFIMENVFQKPHAMLSLSFYILSLGYFYNFLQNNSFRRLIKPLIFILIAAFIYPYLLLSYSLILFIFTTITSVRENKITALKKTVVYLIILNIIGLPYCFYIFSAKDLGDVITPTLNTPNLILFLLGIGLFLIPLVSLIKMVKTNSVLLFIYIWFFVHLGLAYAPLGFARYYFLGVFIPLSYLMVMYLSKLTKKLRIVVSPFILLFSSLSTLMLLIYRNAEVLTNNPKYYLDERDIETIEYISKNIPQNSNLIATYPFSNTLPTIKPLNVYFGHFYQTPDSVNKVKNVIDFFNNDMAQLDAETLINSNNIAYVIWKNENDLWSNFPLLKKPSYNFLKEIFSNEKYSVMIPITSD